MSPLRLRLLERFARNDQLLDLRRALVDAQGSNLTVKTLDDTSCDNARPPVDLNRLIDDGRPGSSIDEAGPAEILESIRRDVEDLLNTRNYHGIDLADRYPESAKSIVGYGLPGADEVMVTDRGDLEELRKAIKETLERYEPRLMNVTVTRPGNPRRLTHEVELVIAATIHVEDYEEKIAWNSTLSGGLIRLQGS